MMRTSVTWTSPKASVEIGCPVNGVTRHMSIAVPVAEAILLLFQKHVWSNKLLTYTIKLQII